MFMQLKMYKNVLFAGALFTLITGLYFYIHSLKNQIENLENTLKESYLEAANIKLEANRYKSALEIQSTKVEALQIDIVKRNEELREWKSKPAKIRYNTIYKIRKVKSDECAQIKAAINSVRYINYSDL